MPKTSIIIINYNNKDFLKNCLNAVFNQTHKNFEVILADNNSSDSSVSYVIKKYPSVKIIKNTENLGYGKAANQGIKVSNNDYVMILNPDVILEPDYLEKSIKKMEKDKKIGALGGKLLKMERGKKTDIIDSTGIVATESRKFVDRGQGEGGVTNDKCQIHKNKYNTSEEVFAVSGACPIFRREALEDIKISNEYFDENFFLYKEDIDICWRMRLLKWKCFYLPEIVAYHIRGTGAFKRNKILQTLKERKKLSKFQKYHSYINHRLMIFKNELCGNFWKDFLWIFGREIMIFFYIIFREPFLIKAWFEILKKLPSTFWKRRKIMKKRRVGWREMERWFK